MKLFKGHNASIVNYLFQILLVTYLVLLLVEEIWAGFVLIYLNLNYLLVIVILFGILDIFSEKIEKIDKKANKKDYVFAILLGLVGFFIIKYKTADLGGLSWLISIIAGVLILLLSFLVLDGDTENSLNSQVLALGGKASKDE